MSVVENVNSLFVDLRIDITGIDPVKILKMLWDLKFNNYVRRMQGVFDYKEAEKVVNGYVGIFCERVINADFSVKPFVKFFSVNTNDDYVYRKLIELSEGDEFKSFPLEELEFFREDQKFLVDFRQALSEFEFTHKKSQIFSVKSGFENPTREYFPKMFESFNTIDRVEFDNFYGRGSFESIIESIFQKYTLEGIFRW
jgi:hypothetical protein